MMRSMTGDTVAPVRPQARNNWLPFIHGLRGIASMSVALFHCYFSTPVAAELASWMPPMLDSVLNLGFLGVDLFFVISGFVIALTLYGKLQSIAEWGRFLVRRQLRLDPPYWTAIVMSIASAVIVNRLRPLTQAPVPGFGDVLAHLFYLQDFLGLKAIAGIFWTLCLEIQFYLFFGAVVLLKDRTPISGRGFAWLMLPLYLLSLASFWGLVPSPRGLFLPRWFEFFTGVVLFMKWRRHIGYPELLVYLGCAMLSMALPVPDDEQIAAVTTVTVVLIALLFTLAIEGDGLTRWLDNRVLRYLGTISYSLYLMHAVIGIRLLKIVVKPGSPAVLTLVLYAGSLALSVLASDVIFRFIERPSMNLSHRLRWRRPEATPAGAQSH
jgi:peptidoglycan/LPS O-acetylase OafA/YrhL